MDPTADAIVEERERVQMWVGVPDGGLAFTEQPRATTCKLGGRATFSQTDAGQAAEAALKEKANCSVCGDAMYLLVQSFCPDDEMERIIYVLVCNSSHCHEKKDRCAPWKVFRFQEKEILDDERPGALDAEEEDLEDIAVPPAQKWCYPEMAFDTFEEPEVTSNAEELAKIEGASGGGEAGGELSDSITPEDLTSVEASGCVNMTDETVAKFQARLSRCPQQVLRWGRGAKPLWLSMDFL